MTQDGPKAPTPAAIAVVLAPALSSFAAAGLIPVLPQMVRAFGGNTQLITLTVTLPLLAAALATALLGVLGDRFPRRTVFIASAGLYAVAAPLPGVLDGLSLILAARFVTGLAMGFMVASSLGLIGDLFTSERRAAWVSAQSIIAAALTIGGTALNGFLGQYGWHYAFLIYLLGIPVFLMAWTLPGRASVEQTGAAVAGVPKVPFPWRTTSVIFALVIVGILLVVPASYEMVYLLSERGVGSSVMIGNMSAIIAGGAALGAFLLPAIRRLAPAFALAISLGLSGLGQFLIVGAGVSLAPLMLGVLLSGAAQGLFMAAAAVWLLNTVDGAVRGRATGLFRTLIYVSGFAAPQLARLCSGALGSSQNTYLVYACAAALLAVLLVGSQIIRRKDLKPATI